MESCALPLSSPFLQSAKHRIRNPSKSSRPSSLASFPPTPSKSLQLSLLRCASSSSSSISCFDGRNYSLPAPVSNRRSKTFKLQAVSVPENADGAAKAKDSARALQLVTMFAIWYLLNIFFNISNKQVLKVFPFPATVTAFQFGCGTVLILLMWGFNLHPKPRITRSQFATILPLAIIHTTGNILTNISIGKVAVSFTHTIKAMEPFFTVMLSALFLGVRPNIWVVASLVPIVGGVALASLTEASFNWVGFSSAMASNLTNQSRNVLSKKFMVNKEEAMDNINLFSIITIISFLLLSPIAILTEGVKLSPSYLQFAASQGLNIRELILRALVAGFCFHTYQQVSYMILEMVSPVSHAVGNCLKRVVVIVSTVLFFRTPVSPVNSLGTAVALAGVFLYSRAKRIKPKAQ